MRKTWIGAMVVAIITGLVVTHAATLGLQSAWPFAVGLALAPLGARGKGLVKTSLSVVAGVGASVAVFVAVSLWMPFIPVSFGIAVGVAVAGLGTAAILLPRRLNLPAMLVSFAVFYGSYESQWVANRAAFRSEAAAAAAGVVLAIFGGVVASFAVSQMLAIEARQRAGEVIPFRARLRVAATDDRPAAAAGGGM